MKKLAILLLLISTQFYALTTAKASSYDILKDLNTYRATYHLSPLEENSMLCSLAKLRVEQIKTDWSHNNFQGEIDAISNMDGVFHENLARSFEPKDVVWAWSMSQAGHKEAMLIPDMKYGCIAQSNGYYAFEGYIPK